MSVKSSDTVKKQKIDAGQGTTKQVLIDGDEAPNFALRRFEIEPGGGMPLHTNKVEHEQYVLGGKAHIRIGDREYDVGKDDVIYIPAGVPHSYDSTGDEPFVFLCVVPNKEDRIEIVEADD